MVKKFVLNPWSEEGFRPCCQMHPDALIRTYTGISQGRNNCDTLWKRILKKWRLIRELKGNSNWWVLPAANDSTTDLHRVVSQIFTE